MSEYRLTPEDIEAARLVGIRLRNVLQGVISGLVAEGRTELHATRITSAALGGAFMAFRTAEQRFESGELKPRLHPPVPDSLPEDL